MMVLLSTFLWCGVAVLVLGRTTGGEAVDDYNDDHPVHKNVCDGRLVVPSNKVDTSSLVFVYSQGGGETTQAYKPNAPQKTSVCNKSSSNDNQLHKVAPWPFWRSEHKDWVPIVVRGNLYSCTGAARKTETTKLTMEVWQPRPDGTYSSIRPGVEEGDCRASVPITPFTTNKNDNNYDNMDTDNNIGRVEFETFAPGSIGILNGLVPSSSRDYPPYKPGGIHMFLNIAGYQPLLTSLSMSDLNDWIPKNISKGRFKLSNGKNYNNGNAGGTNSIHGIEIQSVIPKSQSGYKLAVEVEVNFFLLANGKEAKDDIDDIFCNYRLHRGRWSWIPSFFKEPISVCSAAYMDFFEL